jgi:hypothetical protein
MLDTRTATYLRNLGIEKKLLIGFGFRKGSGKDTACKFAYSKITYGTTLQPAIVHFADALKTGIGREVFGLSDAQMQDQTMKEAVDPYWQLTPRKILQLGGTEALRNTFSSDVWVKALLRRIANDSTHDVFLIGDVRFPNEFEAIRELGGFNVYLTRMPEDVEDSSNQHASEIALEGYLDQFDYHLQNEGTLGETCESVETLVWAIIAAWQNRRVLARRDVGPSDQAK